MSRVDWVFLTAVICITIGAAMKFGIASTLIGVGVALIVLLILALSYP